MSPTIQPDEQYSGQCFCGDVKFKLSGKPEVMAYCHCNSCRHWSAGPVSAFTLWKPENLEITEGLELIAGFDKNPGTDDQTVVSNRVWCKHCGGHIYTDHPTMGVIDIPAAVIQNFSFQPQFHVHYRETKLSMKDGLPKFRDLPAAAGGSGIELIE